MITSLVSLWDFKNLVEKNNFSLSLFFDRSIQMTAEVEKKLQSFLEFRE